MDPTRTPPIDPRRTLVLIPCSNSKAPGSETDGVGASVLDSLPDELADRLVAARTANESRAGVDATSMPAWRRYSRGLLYRSAHPTLDRAVHEWPHILILSGAYGVVSAREPIANYSAPLSLADWPGGLLQEVLTEYARHHEITRVAAFMSRVGDYRALLELTGWPESVTDVTLHLALYPYSLDPRLTAPRIQGEALAAYLEGENLGTWADTTGTGGIERIPLLRTDPPTTTATVEDAPPPAPEATPVPSPTAPDPDAPIAAVLVKAATVRQHLRENLQLIDVGARGRRVTYSYKERWVAPGIAERLQPGVTVLIALGGRPYARLMPVRLARIVGRDESQGSLVVLELELGALVEPDVDALSEAITGLPDDRRPSAAFVTPPAPGFVPHEVADADHSRVWGAVVEHLQGDPSYRETVFLRLDGVDGGGPDGPMVGDTVTVRVECRAEHIPPEERADARLVADAPAWAVEHDAPVPDRGVIALNRTADPQDRPELAFTVGVRGRWAVSSLIDVTLPVRARPNEAGPPPTPAPVGAPSVDDVRRLVQAMHREGTPPTLALLEDHLLRWCAGDPKLEALRIAALFDEGRPEDAATALYALEPAVREQIDPRLRFRAAIATHRHADALGALGDMVEVRGDDVAMIAEALGELPSAEVVATVSRVAEHLLGDRSFATLVAGIDPLRLEPGDALALAEYVEQVLAGDEAVDWLQRRLVRMYEPELAAFAARVAAESPGRQTLGRWVIDLLLDDLADQRAGGGRSPIARLEELRGDLDEETRRDAVLRLGEQIDPLGPLVPQLDLVAREALAREDFETAASVVALLHRAETGGAAHELRVHLEEALSQLQTVRKYLELDYTERLKRAAAKTKGRDLIIVGGPAEKTPVKEHLLATFAFASATWLPCTRGQKPPLDALSDLRSDRHTVVIVIGHIGHSTSEPVGELCRKAGVRPCQVHSDGARTIERKLVEEHAPTGR